MDNTLNKYLQPINSPVILNDNFVNTIDWDIFHPRDTVSGIHVKALSFSNLTGGTAVLGGASNGDGLLIVNNAGGTQVVRLDNSGIVITAGTITGVQFTGTTTQTTGTFDAITVTGQSINNGTITNNKLITGGTYNSFVSGTPAITGGAVNNAVFGTQDATGGTIRSAVVNNSTIGTPALSGGTLNPSVYQGAGTAGVTGTAIYVKTVDFAGSSVTSGTIITKNGIVISIN